MKQPLPDGVVCLGDTGDGRTVYYIRRAGRDETTTMVSSGPTLTLTKVAVGVGAPSPIIGRGPHACTPGHP